MNEYGTGYHVPVLLEPTMESLHIKPDGIYVDGTAGGGGHSFAIASKLTAGGRLISLDQDPDAIKEASARLAGLPATVVQSNFAEMRAALDSVGVDKVDGVLLDIGVSSHQLDCAERGFSYHEDAPLDMRMSQSGITAADLVNTLPEDELATIFFKYGEEKFSRRIARLIAEQRETAPITTTSALAAVIAAAYPAKARRDGHPARRVFQALRIAVNDELGCLERGLKAAFDALNPGGRLAVITFHSLEDRLVKEQFRDWMTGCTCPKDFPVCVCGNKPKAVAVTRKPITATDEELAENHRSRSAKLRVIEKCQNW